MSTWADIDEQDDHYLGLAGANVVATEALLVLRDNLADVVAAKAMMCVHGDAGLGKTLSASASLRALAPADVCRVQFRARPTPRDIRHVLFDALAISGTPPTRPIEFDALLKDALAERFRVLVCDEAQWLSRECFELWRHLWDDQRTDIAIVFVGGGDCYRVLGREPMLSSRVYVWQEFRRLDREQVLAVIPAYHPVWAGADPADIAYADVHAGHGNFRAWSKITAHVVTALARLDRGRADREILQWVFSRLGGSGGEGPGPAGPRRRHAGERGPAGAPRSGPGPRGRAPHARHLQPAGLRPRCAGRAGQGGEPAGRRAARRASDGLAGGGRLDGDRPGRGSGGAASRPARRRRLDPGTRAVPGDRQPGAAGLSHPADPGPPGRCPGRYRPPAAHRPAAGPEPPWHTPASPALARRGRRGRA